MDFAKSAICEYTYFIVRYHVKFLFALVHVRANVRHGDCAIFELSQATTNLSVYEVSGPSHADNSNVSGLKQHAYC